MFDAGITIIHRASGHVLGTIFSRAVSHPAVVPGEYLMQHQVMQTQEWPRCYASDRALRTILYQVALH